MNKTIAGIAAVGAIALGAATLMKTPAGATGGTGTTTWMGTVGTTLYDTPSGNLDVGYYEILNGGVLFGHLATSTTATTTRPTGYYVPPNALGLTRANRIGTRYIDRFADGTSYVGSSTVDDRFTILNIPNAPVPDEADDQAAGSAL